jgi:zinc transport system permease protein
MIELLLPPLLAGLAIAVAAGPLGAFVVWRRMAFFGDTLAHGALLGAAFGLLINVNIYIAIVVTCLLLALVLVTLQQQHHIANDTLLGIVAHSTLALGIIAISLQPNVRVDLMAFLFGDLLAVGWRDVWLLWGATILMTVAIIFSWRWLLSMTVNEEMAQVEGVPVFASRLILMLILALLVAGAIHVVGVLLMTSLLVIPAACARRFSTTPEQMALFASVLGMLSVVGGLAMSWFVNTPVGPSVVTMAAAMFVFPLAVPARKSA